MAASRRGNRTGSPKPSSNTDEQRGLRPPRGQPRSPAGRSGRRLNDANALVGGVGDEERVVADGRDAEWPVELGGQRRAAVAAVARRACPGRVVGDPEYVERLHDVRTGVGQVQAVAAVDGDRRRCGEACVPAGKCGDVACRVDAADGGVAGVGDVQVAEPVADDVGGAGGLGGPGVAVVTGDRDG